MTDLGTLPILGHDTPFGPRSGVIIAKEQFGRRPSARFSSAHSQSRPAERQNRRPNQNAARRANRSNRRGPTSAALSQLPIIASSSMRPGIVAHFCRFRLSGQTARRRLHLVLPSMSRSELARALLVDELSIQPPQESLVSHRRIWDSDRPRHDRAQHLFLARVTGFPIAAPISWRDIQAGVGRMRSPFENPLARRGQLCGRMHE